jgi:nitrite reductase/ring-hydroxylating ferredoxin subunit
MFPWHRKPPKDGRSRRQNQSTQPRRRQPVFDNPAVLTEGWYPVCRSRALTPGKVIGEDFLDQRVVVFRDAEGQARCLDAFCAHMGADLSRGDVVDGRLRCYFHRWCFDPDGELAAVAGEPPPRDRRLTSWPCQEAYGFVWVYAGAEAPYDVPRPPGLEDAGELDAWHLGSTTLYVHHHVLMASGIDLAHFASVHDLDVDFDFEVDSVAPHVFDWKLEGEIPPQGWKGRLGRWLLGPTFRYRTRFAGGSVCAITYGWDQRWRGHGRELPSLHVLWGCVPLESGVSRCEIFLVAPRGRGLEGWARARLRQLGTLGLLAVLKDEDVQAFPRMRFDPGGFAPGDESVARLVKLFNDLPRSPWTPAAQALDV